MGGFQHSFGEGYEQGSVDSHYIETPEQVGLRYSVAGIGSRFVALLLDNLILVGAGILEILLLVWFASFAHETGPSSPAAEAAAKWFIAILILLNFAVFVGYFAIFETFWKGQTPGKRVMKIRVIKDTGRQVTFFEALTRSLVMVIDGLPGFYLVGLITMICNRQSKRVGDFIAGTLVVHERLEDQPLIVQPSAMIFDGSDRGRQPLEPWRTPSAPALFPADAIAKLSPQDLVVIEAFFARALDLTLELRAAMAYRIAGQLAAKMGMALPEGNPERALESIAYAMRGAGRASW